MTTPRCIGEPVSWLRLERLALGELTPATAAEVRAHLDACPACAAALAQITDDDRRLPRLVAAVAPTPWWRRWPGWAIGGVALSAAAAALTIGLVRPTAPSAIDGVRVKGAGTVAVTLVRERAGAIAFDPATVAGGDRWKVEISCGAGAVWVDVAVLQGARIDFPLEPARVPCGNHAPVPGAFRITDGGAQVCVLVDATAPDRAAFARGDRTQARCRTLRAQTR